VDRVAKARQVLYKVTARIGEGLAVGSAVELTMWLLAQVFNFENVGSRVTFGCGAPRGPVRDRRKVEPKEAEEGEFHKGPHREAMVA